MGIVVACRCGQAFEADLYLAGKVVQCPACRSPIAIPTPAAEPPPAASYIPRPRTAVSRESQEATESITKILVAGGVLLVMVLGLSVAIMCYLQGTNPIDWIAKLREQGKREREARAAARAALAGEKSPTSVLSGPVPVSPPTAKESGGSAPVVPSSAAPTAMSGVPTSSGLPEGWGFYEHPGGKFSAMLPAEPEYLERKVEGVGGVQTYYTLSVAQNEHVYEATRELRSFTIARGEESGVYDFLLKNRETEMEEGRIEGSNKAMVDDRLVCDAILGGKEDGVNYRKYIRLIAKDNSVFELSCRVPVGKERPADIGAFLGKYQLH